MCGCSSFLFAVAVSAALLWDTRLTELSVGLHTWANPGALTIVQFMDAPGVVA